MLGQPVEHMTITHQTKIQTFNFFFFIHKFVMILRVIKGDQLFT
jgi:hypothetical protein